MDNPEAATAAGKESYRRSVAEWGQRPRDKDRDGAIRVIEAAAARGQIVDADRAKRVEEVRAAGTMAEIEMITRGLAQPEPAGVTPPSPTPTFETYTPPTTVPVSGPDPSADAPVVQYGEPLTSTYGTSVATPAAAPRGGHTGKLVLVVVLIVMAGVAVPIVLGIRSLVDTVNDGIEDLTPGNADVFSTEGLQALADDLEEETGSTQVFSATLYPGYAYMEVPAEPTGQRMYRYYWDGDLEQQGKGKATQTERMDLTTIRVDVIERLLERINRRVEDATSNYVIAHAPGPTDEGAALYAYASNDFSEGGYISATIDGKVIRTTTW